MLRKRTEKHSLSTDWTVLLKNSVDDDTDDDEADGFDVVDNDEIARAHARTRAHTRTTRSCARINT